MKFSADMVLPYAVDSGRAARPVRPEQPERGSELPGSDQQRDRERARMVRITA